MRLVAATALLCITAHASPPRRSLVLTATVIPMNEIAVNVIDDIAIVDATIFGVHHHKAFVIDDTSVVTANADGLRVDDETALVSR